MSREIRKETLQRREGEERREERRVEERKEERGGMREEIGEE